MNAEVMSLCHTHIGMSQCGPVAQTFFIDPYVQRHMQLDAIVCVCDSPRLLRLLRPGHAEDGRKDVTALAEAKELPVVQEQLALADLVLLNKLDGLAREDVEVLRLHAQTVAPGSRVLDVAREQNTGTLQLDTASVLFLRAFRLDKVTLDAHFLGGSAGKHHHKHQHQHLHHKLGYRTVGLELLETPVDWAKLNIWLQKVCEKHSAQLCRFKAVLWCVHQDREERVVVQGAYGQFEWSDDLSWGVEENRLSRLVFIGDINSALEAKLNTALSAHMVFDYHERKEKFINREALVEMDQRQKG
jgi:G3E family GTPase